MTSTQQETPAPALPIGQAVGQAEAVLTKLLNVTLTGRGIDRQAYLGLQRLNALGGQATQEAYEHDLRDWLELDAAAASRLTGELISAGLAAAGPSADGGAGGTVRLTAEGQAMRSDILMAGRQLTGPVLAAIDPGDLQTTIRTLEEITRRARQIAVRPISGEPAS
jgi:DNA-binding MarR family transcriptional regulator